MGILSRLNNSHDGEPEQQPPGVSAGRDQRAHPPDGADGEAADHPPREEADISIGTNDADNTVFADPKEEEKAREELRDLTEGALRETGAIEN